MDLLLLLPSILQGLVMLVDEFYFHKKRGLGRWERVGHPVDTATVLVCYGVLLCSAFSTHALALFVGASALSCLVVTKDEFVHQQACSPYETWLHSWLFILHPLVLGAAGLSWYLMQSPQSALWAAMPHLSPLTLRLALWGQAGIILGFFTYQTLYWNVLCKPSTSLRPSITTSTTRSVSVGTAPSMIR